MKMRAAVPGILIILTALLSFSFPAYAMDEPLFIINRMVVSEIIADKEPAAIGDTFSAATEKVYCFLEARNIEEDTTVSFVWYFNGKEMARVMLPLTKGKRWRTYSSKKLAGLKGIWKVELHDYSGIVLNTVSFQVQ